MTGERWASFCVVGLGSHARTKLIPAILANGQKLTAVVTRSEDVPTGAQRFASMTDALISLPVETAFVIASPPAAHFGQAMAALEAGRDVIVEKPAFASAAEAQAAAGVAQASGALLVEGFMNRHTATHRHFVAHWAEQRPASVDFTFTIPQAPEGTFRSDPAIASSSLYDMGCYLLAALDDAGLSLDGLELVRLDHAGQPDRERLRLEGDLDGVALRALVGVDESYVNRLKLTRADGSTIEYTPFIYGRPGPRRIVRARDGASDEEVIEDVNAFQAMFAVPRAVWRESQPQRLAQIVRLAEHLERLGAALELARRGR